MKTIPGWPGPDPPPKRLDARESRKARNEILLFLLFCYLPYLYFSIDCILHPYDVDSSSALDSLFLLIQSAITISITILIIRHSEKGPAYFGVKKFDGIADVFNILLLYFGAYMSPVIAHRLLYVLKIQDENLSKLVKPGDGWEWVLLILALIANSIAEELGMRSFLITRLRDVLNSSSLAVLVSAVLFASYHSYLGLGGTLSSFGFGLGFGVVFLVTKKVWPLVIAHTIYNVMVYAW